MSRLYSALTSIVVGSIIAAYVVGFLYSTGRWEGSWLWPLVIALPITLLMLWASLVLKVDEGDKPRPGRTPPTWQQYLSAKLIGAIFTTLVVTALLGLQGDRILPFWLMYLLCLGLNILWDGVETAIKRAWRKLRAKA